MDGLEGAVMQVRLEKGKYHHIVSLIMWNLKKCIQMNLSQMISYRYKNKLMVSRS